MGQVTTKVSLRFFSSVAVVAGLLLAVSTNQNAPAASTQKAVIRLSYAAELGPTNLEGGISVARWAKAVARRTNGRVQITIHYSEVLLTQGDALEGLKKGIADAGYLVIGYNPAQFPMWSSLGTLHDVDLGRKLTLIDHEEITNELLKQFPEMTDEIERQGLKLIMVHASAPHHIISRKPLRRLDDLKGLKIRIYGTYIPKLFRAAGASPVSIPFGEVYSALSSGTVDAAYSVLDAFDSVKAYEVTGNLTLVGIAPPLQTGLTTLINRRVWNRLPADVQRIMLEEGKNTERWLAEQTVKHDAEVQAKWRRLGVKIFQLPESDFKRWATQTPDFYREVKEDLNAKGLPGTKFVEAYLRLARKKAASK